MPTGNRAYLNEIDTTNILGDEMSSKKKSVLRVKSNNINRVKGEGKKEMK